MDRSILVIKSSKALPTRTLGRNLVARASDANGSETMKAKELDGRHRDKDGAIGTKHGNTLVGTLRKIYGKGFAAGYPDSTTLSEVLQQLNETSLSQLRRDHGTGHLEHKIGEALK
jgi:hypothetical protein